MDERRSRRQRLLGCHKKLAHQEAIIGIALILFHHTGKNGQQRGSSMHEDLLDYSILLSPLQSDANRQDTRFGIEHTKLRDHLPELRQKYECSIWTEDESREFEVCRPASTNHSMKPLCLGCTKTASPWTKSESNSGYRNQRLAEHSKSCANEH